MPRQLRTWFDHAGPLPQALAGLGALLAVLLLAALLLRAGRLLRGKKAADTLTVLAAAMASSVAATGMWHFFSRTMHLPTWIQAVLFAFMEISVLASALRARANVARDGQAGADGAAVWVLTSASGLMSASEATSPQEALVRLGAPLVAAWLWERSMVPERRARRAAEGRAEAVRWLFSAKRVAVRLGLATALGANLETEDANRRIDRFVRADNRAQRAGVLTRRRTGRRRDRAHARLMEQARMQADPRALYTHLGRQAILDVLARLGGDDAVIDRERARQMEHILADATADPAAPAAGPNPAPPAPTPPGSAQRTNGTASRPGGPAGRQHTDELPLTLPALISAAEAVSGTHPAFHIPAARHAPAPLTPQPPAPAPTTAATVTTAAAAATGAGGLYGTNGRANGATAYNPGHGTGPHTTGAYSTGARATDVRAAANAAPAAPASLSGTATGATGAPGAAPGAGIGGGSHRAATAPPRSPYQPAPAPPPAHREQILAPVRFVAAPSLDDPAYDAEPDDDPEPAAVSPDLAARILSVMATYPIPPNIMKVANSLGISAGECQDAIDALGGFDAVWSRARQDREAELGDTDLAYYPA